MKSLPLILLLALSFATLAFAADLEKFHCVPSIHPETAHVVHYLINTKTKHYKLSVTSGLKSLKFYQLQGLKMIDNNLDQTLISKDVDVQWRSAKNHLDFQLVINDNGGHTMSGTLTYRGGQVPISCIDTELEK